ncbi:hypothetical protein SPBR_00452 [Sporothrix brasiliensis 5110]|uniref:Uncharacterized protein n=1 Tax=Sporothrix brasiliensis 5110 TaxID=1398154 RepID=A0A0C2FIC8_9PEZI|nr:uncharacterized protein SPBR_00452 [Sporothrix brasiliensis 5110]KIH90808.1 hypothetical protein SPBR_00452 [Sporothrix brasiliensis 5110]
MFQFLASAILCCVSLCLLLWWIWVLLTFCVVMTLLGLGTVLVLIMNPPIFLVFLAVVFVINYRYPSLFMDNEQTADRLQERWALVALAHLGDGRQVPLVAPRRQLPHVRLGHTQPLGALGRARAAAFPDPHLAAGVVPQEDVAAVKVAQRRGAVAHEVKRELARGVAEAPQRLGPRALVRWDAVARRRPRRGHRPVGPERRRRTGARLEAAAALCLLCEETEHHAGPALVLGEHLHAARVRGRQQVLGDLGGLGLFHGAAAAALPHVEGVAAGGVEDKDVVVVEAGRLRGHLVHDNAAVGAGARLLEDAQQHRLLGGSGRGRGLSRSLDVGEARGHAAAADGQALREERQEGGGRARLQLAVLRGGAVQKLVELDRLVRGGAGLVLGRVAAEPEEDFVAERRGARVAADFVRVQHNVAVAVVEETDAVRGHRHHLEVLDAPDKEARLHADDAVVPGGLRGGRGVLDAVVNVGANQLDVAVLDVVLLGVHEAIVGGHGEQ